jgi:hypothetical protein
MEQLLFKESTPLKEGEIIDSSVMNLKSLKRLSLKQLQKLKIKCPTFCSLESDDDESIRSNYFELLSKYILQPFSKSMLSYSMN